MQLIPIWQRIESRLRFIISRLSNCNAIQYPLASLHALLHANGRAVLVWQRAPLMPRRRQKRFLPACTCTGMPTKPSSRSNYVGARTLRADRKPNAGERWIHILPPYVRMQRTECRRSSALSDSPFVVKTDEETPHIMLRVGARVLAH